MGTMTPPPPLQKYYRWNHRPILIRAWEWTTPLIDLGRKLPKKDMKKSTEERLDSIIRSVMDACWPRDGHLYDAEAFGRSGDLFQPQGIVALPLDMWNDMREFFGNGGFTCGGHRTAPMPFIDEPVLHYSFWIIFDPEMRRMYKKALVSTK